MHGAELRYYCTSPTAYDSKRKQTQVTNHRYRFAHGVPKRNCPNCGHKRLRTYVDTETGEEMPTEFGVCDRIESCGYFNPPRMNQEEREPQFRAVQPQAKRTDYRCPQDIVQMTKDHRGNVFAKWLVGLLGAPAQEALREYRVGTYPASQRYPHLTGAMVYWQIGFDGLERAAKVIPYGPDGKRIKEYGATWLHSILYNKSMSEMGIGQVLFGEHLLSERPGATVCLVEAEKSAIIGRAFHPEFVWVATGGSDNFSLERCMCLSGRHLIVMPDVGSYQKWEAKAIDLEPMLLSLTMFDLLEASGYPPGTDVADLLIETMQRLPIAGAEQPPPAPEESPFKEPESSTPAVSPIDRMLEKGGVKALIEELDLDLLNIKVTPYTP